MQLESFLVFLFAHSIIVLIDQPRNKSNKSPLIFLPLMNILNEKKTEYAGVRFAVL